VITLAGWALVIWLAWTGIMSAIYAPEVVIVQGRIIVGNVWVTRAATLAIAILQVLIVVLLLV